MHEKNTSTHPKVQAQGCDKSYKAEEIFVECGFVVHDNESYYEIYVLIDL